MEDRKLCRPGISGPRLRAAGTLGVIATLLCVLPEWARAEGGDLEGTIASQQELDRQKAAAEQTEHPWEIDYAWVKPWGPAGNAQENFPVAHLVAALIENPRTWRPSQHPAGA